MSPMLESEYFGSMEQLFWEATFCYCVSCGSSKDTVSKDAQVLGVVGPTCCEVTYNVR